MPHLLQQIHAQKLVEHAPQVGVRDVVAVQMPSVQLRLQAQAQLRQTHDGRAQITQAPDRGTEEYATPRVRIKK